MKQYKLNNFTTRLLEWNTTAKHREMPWKGEKNPYLVWLSEIILQQTRVEQGLPYFNRFKVQYPSISHLAMAPEDEVMKLWQGLGYYSRARNLHATAKYIHGELNGVFPDNYKDLLTLKGVGKYTAAAIASFVYGENSAVVDGNVIRVLARYWGIRDAFDTGAGRKIFETKASALVAPEDPATYNQAIMDFGATVCTPVNPQCTSCVFNRHCVAYLEELVDDLPVRAKRTKVKDRYFNFIVIRQGNDRFTYLQKRTDSDIWKNLYQFPLIETPQALKKNIRQTVADFLQSDDFQVTAYQGPYQQLLTHRKIHALFVEVAAPANWKPVTGEFICIKQSELANFAVPKVIQRYLTDKQLL